MVVKARYEYAMFLDNKFMFSSSRNLINWFAVQSTTLVETIDFGFVFTYLLSYIVYQSTAHTLSVVFLDPHLAN